MVKHPIKDRVKYIAFSVTAFAVFDAILAASVHRGFAPPQKNPFDPGQWIVEKRVLSKREWWDLERRHLIYLGLTYIFVTGGATVTLASDFNILSNQFIAIGAGAPGAGGGNSTVICSCCGGSIQSGGGGHGGGGGALAQIFNYQAHGAGAVVNIQVGTGDTWFDSATTVLLAKAGNLRAAGSAGSCVFSGGTGANPGANSGGDGGKTSAGAVGGAPSGGSGGGGGGAAGQTPFTGGPGNNGADGSPGQVNTGATIPGGAGGAGDAGNTAAGANGAQFGPNASSQFVGPGGGGNGGSGTYGVPGGAGSNGGFYGAGGGGGGGAGTGSGGNGGNATQGLLVYSYTPAAGSGHSRSYGFISG